MHKWTVHRLVHGNVSFEDTVRQLAIQAHILEFDCAVFKTASLVGAVAQFVGTGVTGAVVFVQIVLEESGDRGA
jgi:hypothetical protein